MSTQHWELGGTPDPGIFLRSLPSVFSGATTFFVEANWMVADVRAVVEAAIDPGEYLPSRQTLWPRSTRWRCRFDEPLMEALAALAGEHAAPELFDHLFLYEGATPLIEYPDAFLDRARIYVTGTLPEERVRGWAAETGLRADWRPV